MSWLFSQALVAEYLPANSSEIERSAQLSGMPTPLVFSSIDKMTGLSQPSRFGMTCALLTDDLGAELLTLFQAASHARTSAAPAIERESLAPGPDCGKSSHGWFAKLSPSKYEWKTPQISLLGGSELFSETWPRSGSMRDGTCFLHPTLAPTICVSASGSLLPTLTVNGNNNRPYEGKKSGFGLATAIAMLPTLTTIGLNGGSNSRKATARRREEPTHIGPLNPDWCEWFMGFPIGWTGLAALETHRFHEWQQQHGNF